MTSASKFGRPSAYPLPKLAVGESFDMPAPTSADIKRIARNVSQYGQRHDRFYRCRTKDGVTTVTRIR